MQTLKFVLCAVLCAANLAHALPKSIQTEYELARNGKVVAKVKESFTQDGKQYRIKSVTKGLGLYALMGERVMTSTGAVTKDGLKPAHFELRQSKSAKKTLMSDFDWPKNTLNMQIKGETRSEKLLPGTQDLASYVYQFMFRPPNKNAIQITLTTGKHLRQYQYQVIARDEPIAGYKTVHIANQAAGDDDKKELWLAQDQNYVPVRYLLIEDGDNFEQTLTKLSVQ